MEPPRPTYQDYVDLIFHSQIFASHFNRWEASVIRILQNITRDLQMATECYSDPHAEQLIFAINTLLVSLQTSQIKTFNSVLGHIHTAFHRIDSSFLAQYINLDGLQHDGNLQALLIQSIAYIMANESTADDLIQYYTHALASTCPRAWAEGRVRILAASYTNALCSYLRDPSYQVVLQKLDIFCSLMPIGPSSVSSAPKRSSSGGTTTTTGGYAKRYTHM